MTGPSEVSAVDARVLLDRLCATARLVLAAAAVSVARVDGDGLVYVAADGVGAGRIVGVRLPAGRGIAGFVAATGQALVIDRPADDPRFAREVAEATGHVPASLLVVPVVDGDGDVAGVVSVLDRSSTASPLSGGDALAVAAAFADEAAVVLTAPPVDAARDDDEVGPLVARMAALQPEVRGRVRRVWADAVDLAERR